MNYRKNEAISFGTAALYNVRFQDVEGIYKRFVRTGTYFNFQCCYFSVTESAVQYVTFLRQHVTTLQPVVTLADAIPSTAGLAVGYIFV
jgi:hypothetical protein